LLLMALTPRQRILYRHKCNLWSQTITKDADGRVSGKTWTLQASAVPCYFLFRESTEAPSVAGGLEADNMFSRDEIHFDGTQTIDADWVIKNVTLDADGSQTAAYGRFWVVSGQPQAVSNQGRRRARMKVVQAVQIEVPPTGVS
jgi:hypothetical protein